MYSRMHASTTHFNSCTRMLLSPARLFARARVRRRRTAVCSSCARMLLQPAHGALAMVALFRAKNGFCMHACTLRRRIAVPALACSSALRNYLLACTRTRAPPPHCSSCARMLLRYLFVVCSPFCFEVLETVFDLIKYYIIRWSHLWYAKLVWAEITELPQQLSAHSLPWGGGFKGIFPPLAGRIDIQIWRIGADRWGVAVETRSKIRNSSASCADLSNLRFAHLSIDEAHLGLATVPAGFRAFQI